MRLVTFKSGGGTRVGVVDGEDVIDLNGLAPDLPGSMKDVIAAGLPADLAGRVKGAPASARRPLKDVQLTIPIADPGKIICVGLNYEDHAKEGGNAVPDYPALFMRVPTSLVGPGEPLIVPKASEKMDYEAELMVVIGKKARHLSEEQALDAVFGYTCFNEGSVRDYQRKTSQWTAGKNFDRTGPMGPWIVTSDEVPTGARGLRIRSILNGDKVLQDANTDLMIFPVARVVSIISEVMTLEPGDVIATGTPAGVGHPRKPPLWLKPGDTITIDIEKVGVLTNPVAAEQ